MSWWNRRSRQGNVVRLPRLPDDAMPKMADPNCVCCYIRNDSEVPLTFVSKLEEALPHVIEADAWKIWVLQPGEKKLVPHRYWDVLPHNVERKITVSEIPLNHEPVEFIYKTRTIEKDSAAGAPHFQSADSDTPS